MIFNRFDSAMTARLYAGEPLTLEIQLSDEAGFVEHLDGRMFALRVRDYHGEVVPGAIAAGVIGSDSQGQYAAATLSGAQTAQLTAIVEPTYELVELLMNGEDVLAAGGLAVEARGAVPDDAPPTTAPGVSGRFERRISRSAIRLSVVQRGGRGFTPEERLAFTRDPATSAPWIPEPTVPAMADWMRKPAADAAVAAGSVVDGLVADVDDALVASEAARVGAIAATDAAAATTIATDAARVAAQAVADSAPQLLTARDEAVAAAGSILPTVGIASRRTTTFEGYPDYWLVASDAAGALRLVQATDSRRFTSFNQDVAPIDARLHAVEAIGPIGKADVGLASTRTSTFEGYPDRWSVIADTAGALRLTEAIDARRFNQSVFGAAVAAPTIRLPTEWDMIAILGQSNADGRGAGRVALLASTALMWKGGLLQALADPVGIEVNSSGSAWPAFAQRWFERTGRGVILVPCARGGTTLIDSAESGYGTWGPGGGSFTGPTLRERAVANIAAAKAAATAAGLAWQFAGVVWSEGETVAGRITAGTTTAASSYAAGFEPLLEYIRTQTGAGAKMPWVIARTGFPVNADTVGAKAVRAAQEQWCRDYANVWMGWTGAITLPPRGLMLNANAGELHYNQVGYDEMGWSLATVASTVMLGRC